MKKNFFFIALEGLSFGEKQKFDKKQWIQALRTDPSIFTSIAPALLDRSNESS